MNLSKIENLVFEGGGVKGAVYAGCIQVMDESNLYAQTKRVAGTSAGSITAALLAVGAGSEGLTESILDTKFGQFIYDRGGIILDIYRIFWHYGIHSGNSFAKILKNYIKKFGGDANLTFKQLEQKIATQQNTSEPNKFKHLSVIASNITTQKTDIFDSKRTPDIPIWKAVRCSMSIPGIFEPFKINGNYYVDGGLADNYPIDIFDEKHLDGEDVRNPATLGFYIEPRDEINHPEFKPDPMEIKSLISAIEATAGFLFNTANSKHIHAGDRLRTVFVDDLGVSGTNFNISEKMVKALVESGRQATQAFIDKHKSD